MRDGDGNLWPIKGGEGNLWPIRVGDSFLRGRGWIGEEVERLEVDFIGDDVSGFAGVDADGLQRSGGSELLTDPP